MSAPSWDQWIVRHYNPLNSPTTIEFSPQTGLFQPGAELFQSPIEAIAVTVWGLFPLWRKSQAFKISDWRFQSSKFHQTKIPDNIGDIENSIKPKIFPDSKFYETADFCPSKVHNGIGRPICSATAEARTAFCHSRQTFPNSRMEIRF
jgi:hypothetical protein